MSVKIRLRRTGANKDISYRVVATDSRFPRDGRFLEILGWYDPKKKGVNYSLKLDRVEFWHKNGAKLSPVVSTLYKKSKKSAVS